MFYVVTISDSNVMILKLPHTNAKTYFLQICSFTLAENQYHPTRASMVFQAGHFADIYIWQIVVKTKSKPKHYQDIS